MSKDTEGGGGEVCVCMCVGRWGGWDRVGAADEKPQRSKSCMHVHKPQMCTNRMCWDDLGLSLAHYVDNKMRVIKMQY